MHTDFSESTSPSRQEFDLPIPKPGEIWELSRCVRSPLEFSDQEQQKLYSKSAQRFLEGNCPPRYVMIVEELEAAGEREEEWQIVSVMLLSSEIEFLSDVDLLIPSVVSGVGQDMLAETWHVLPMLACNLSRRVGQRLSREIYDLMLTVGDYYHDQVDKPPSIQEIEALGLKAGIVLAKQQPEIHAFHQREENWSDVLSVPLAAYRTYLQTMELTDAILDEALQLEQEFAAVSTEALDQAEVEAGKSTAATLASTALSKTRVALSDWFQNIFEAQWQAIEDLWNAQGRNLAIPASIGVRSDGIHSDRSNPDEIAALIDQLSPGQDEHQRRKAAQCLGEIAFGHSEAIQALVNLLRTTQNDETLWTAVESLWQIDPGNPAAGVRRVKRVDWGMQVAGEAVALAVALVQKGDRQFGVLLQVYPTGNTDAPSTASPRLAYLPPHLKLILLDDSGQILYEVKARQADVYIQLKFSGQAGEQFSVRVALGEASITEDFVL